MLLSCLWCSGNDDFASCCEFQSANLYAASAGIAGKTTANQRCYVAGDEIAVEAPAKSLVAGLNQLDMLKLAVEIPVIWK